MRSELLPLPRDKFDTEAASAIARAGWPQIEPIVLQVLAWLHDANWPVAKILAPALAGIGSPLEPFVRQVLGTGDEIWKYHLIEQLVAHSPELRISLRPELERIAGSPTEAERAEHVDRVAQDVLDLHSS